MYGKSLWLLLIRDFECGIEKFCGRLVHFQRSNMGSNAGSNSEKLKTPLDIVTSICEVEAWFAIQQLCVSLTLFDVSELVRNDKK